MSLAHNNPNTIYLGGPIEKLNEHAAGVAITPGMELEFYNDSGAMKLRPLASATEKSPCIIALEKSLHNKTVSDTYAIGELVYAAKFLPGSSFWGCIESGADIDAGEYLQANGAGWQKSATATTADANLAVKQALEDSGGAVAVVTRLRMQVIG